MYKFSYVKSGVTIENFIKFRYKKLNEEYEIIEKISNGLLGGIYKIKNIKT